MVEVEELQAKIFLCTESDCRAELGFTAGLETQGDPVTITLDGRLPTFLIEKMGKNLRKL
jgi:hypothetical protein